MQQRPRRHNSSKSQDIPVKLLRRRSQPPVYRKPVNPLPPPEQEHENSFFEDSEIPEHLKLNIPIAVPEMPPKKANARSHPAVATKRKSFPLDPSTTSSTNSEFPQLAAKGLYAFEIKGDGNCLFRALSDQYYGDAGKAHPEIRKTIIDFLRSHPDDFKVFIECEGEETWEQHLSRMSRDGVFGDHAEIVAFSRAANVNVIIYQRTTHFLITPDEGELDTERDRVSAAKAIRSRRTLHIAYHNWEHYSSIRKVAGPHSGLPQIDFKLRMSGDPSSKSGERLGSEKKAVKKEVASKVQMILQSCPFMGKSQASQKLAELVLLDNRLDVDKAIEAVYEDPDRFTEPAETTAPAGTEGQTEEPNRKKVPRKMTPREKKEKQKREQIERRKQAKVAGPAASIMSETSEDGMAPSIMAIPI